MPQLKKTSFIIYNNFIYTIIKINYQNVSVKTMFILNICFYNFLLIFFFSKNM